MFQTDDAWKVRNSGAVRLDVNQRGRQKYRCMEIPLNLPIFHVDLGERADGELVWSRYQVVEIGHVEEFLDLDEVFVRLSLQTRRSDSDNYEIVRIKEIHRSKDGAGNIGYVYIDTDGRDHPDFRWHGEVALGSHTTTVWTDSSVDATR